MPRTLALWFTCTLLVGCAHDPAALGSTCVAGEFMEGQDLNATIRIEFAEGSQPIGYWHANIWVNGQQTSGPWTMKTVLAPPGKIHVEVARRWLGGQRGGLAAIDLDAAAGETVCLRYEKGLLPIFGGSLTRLPPPK